jgi:hypothetical protein
MNSDYSRFDKLKARDRLDLFEATAAQLGATTQSIEKDFWVCRTIDALFKGMPKQPKLFFKGGTSLSKGYGLIQRFSEDIDIVLSRTGLRAKGEDDPFTPSLSATKRKAAGKRLKKICSDHVQGRMRERLIPLLPMCQITEDEDDEDGASLQIKYPSILRADGYLKPFVKVECGARGALEPIQMRPISPYVQEFVGSRFNLTTPSVTLIAARRTFWEKALILHGVHCGFRDESMRPSDQNPISRHYYDVAMMAGHAEGAKALKDLALLHEVREHKLLIFKRPWEKLKEAHPGSIWLVPQKEIQADLDRDYERMSGMMFGEPPDFAWVLAELSKLEKTINS